VVLWVEGWIERVGEEEVFGLCGGAEDDLAPGFVWRGQ
jgi:hypothetical protein